MTSGSGSEIYIGLMSGTSLDGVDVTIVDFADFPPRLIHCQSTAYEDSLRQQLRELIQSPQTTLEQLYRLDAVLGHRLRHSPRIERTNEIDGQEQYDDYRYDPPGSFQEHCQMLIWNSR